MTPTVTVDAEPPEHPVVSRLATQGPLRARIRRGVIWAGGLRVAMQVVKITGTVVLARLLRPSDYGLIAIVTAVNGFATLLTQLGLAGAVVHTRRLTERFLSTAFWINAVTGVILTLIVVAAAEPIAAFFGHPELVPLLRVSSLTFTLSVGAIHVGLLQRALRFGRLGTIELVGAIVALVTAIVFAALGAGAMSLVLGPVAGAVATTLGYWTSVRWLPTGRPDRASLRELWRFSGGLTGFNIVNYWSRNADNLLIGKYATAQALGYYGKAYTLMMLPLTEVSNVISRVMFPALVEIRDDPVRFRRVWLKTVRIALVLSIPFAVGVTVTAPALVIVVFGPRWAGMTTVLALLAASIPPQIVGRTFGPVFQATGQTGLQFKLSIASTLVSLAAIVVGLRWGIEGVATAVLVKKWLTVALPLFFVGRLSLIKQREIYGVAWRSVPAYLLTALAGYLPRLLVPDGSPHIVLAAQCTAMLVAYAAYVYINERHVLLSLVRGGS